MRSTSASRRSGFDGPNNNHSRLRPVFWFLRTTPDACFCRFAHRFCATERRHGPFLSGFSHRAGRKRANARRRVFPILRLASRAHVAGCASNAARINAVLTADAPCEYCVEKRVSRIPARLGLYPHRNLGSTEAFGFVKGAVCPTERLVRFVITTPLRNAS